MKTDIVFPENNEKEFVKIAEKLDYDMLIFVYENQIPVLKIDSSIKIIQKKAKEFAEGGAKTRHYLESGNTKFVYGLEDKQAKDFMHHRASGLNHVLCKIARDKKKIIGFSFRMILNSSGFERARVIGRIMQNIKLCRKYKVKMFIGSFAKNPIEMRAHHDLQAFFQVIGMTGKEVSEE